MGINSLRILPGPKSAETQSSLFHLTLLPPNLHISTCDRGSMLVTEEAQSIKWHPPLYWGHCIPLQERNSFFQYVAICHFSPPTLCSLARLPSRHLDPHLKPSKWLQAQVTKSLADVKLSRWPTSPCPHSTNRYHVGMLLPTLDQLVVSFSLMLTQGPNAL